MLLAKLLDVLLSLPLSFANQDMISLALYKDTMPLGYIINSSGSKSKNASLAALGSLREAIVTRAREWIGTPFAHQAGLKQVGCDCLGLIFGVLREVGAPIKVSGGHAYHYEDESNFVRLKEALSCWLTPEPLAQAGSIGLFSKEERTAHLAIFADYGGGALRHLKGTRCAQEGGRLSIIHACMSAQKVVEHALVGSLQARLRAVYSP